MMTGSKILYLPAALLTASALLAQDPDFSGTWKLDPDESRVTAETIYAGLIASGAPERLHITHAKNGTLVIESESNPSSARIYVPGGKSSTAVHLGQPGSITMTSRWDGQRLVSEGRRESKTDTSTSSFDVREVFSLSSDGTLAIEIVTTGSEGESVSTLVYARTSDVGPCESWVSPCKTPER